MGLLDTFLDAVSKQAVPSPTKDVAAHADAIAHLKDYLRTFPEKKAIAFSDKPDYQRLLSLIDIDLVDASVTDQEATALKKDLALTGTIMQRIKHVELLRRSLFYTENKYDYCHQLMKELHATLSAELRICRALIASSDQSLVLAMRAQIKVEERIVADIEKFNHQVALGNFATHFANLLAGVQVVRRLNETERQMLKRINHILPPEVMARKGAPAGITRKFEYQLMGKVFAAMWERMEEAQVASTEFYNHPNLERHFVNSSLFAEVAERVYYELRPGPPSESSRAYINAFIAYFRKGFNDVDVA
jgi:hypothetical protein